MTSKSSRNASLALSLAALAAGMLMLAYASVPLYRLFCEMTGFGGTPRTAEAAAPGAVVDAPAITVRFNADIDANLPWDFIPDEKEILARPGESRLTSYTAHNRAGTAVTGHATYNVVPEAAGAYFAKVECFCFKDQTLAAGQRVHMPVSFFIDPAILEDPNLKNLRTITLSYTFFATKNAKTDNAK